jgi:hypothetical protein
MARVGRGLAGKTIRTVHFIENEADLSKTKQTFIENGAGRGFIDGKAGGGAGAQIAACQMFVSEWKTFCRAMAIRQSTGVECFGRVKVTAGPLLQQI